ncbi:hypothetical protein B0G69_4354 [Paraburkholderia sp. RAU2J]|uniref:hypothetical protein n=1 Tax=Paraburkholderia sp. RAU2J TaxID=1938810 RepID=UPI000EAFF4E0|nr:hypothetical protein [Paraburkholderia sp. RAU2J]RKT20985.1 hypothetical protein B0G69_4354 [Paraburkholderia sp. RAU2J]
MTCLNERIVGAILFVLSGFAFADSFIGNAPVEMTVTNIAPMPMEVGSAIAEPQRYLQHYEMEYQPSRGEPFYAQLDQFYTAQVTHEFRSGAAKTGSGTQAPTQPTPGYLRMGPSTAPQLSLIDLPNTTLTLRAQPQRRLSLTVDQWVVSATARIAIFHSHSTGATVSVRRGF